MPPFTVARLPAHLPQADFVARTRPPTEETRGVIGADAPGRMQRSAFLVNAARSLRRFGCVDRGAVHRPFGWRRTGHDRSQAAGTELSAMVDVQRLPDPAHRWWTRQYEANVIEIPLENLERLWRGETELRNQVV